MEGRDTYKSAYALYKGQELILNAFKSVRIPIKATKGEGLKILIALAQLKVGNTSESLLNEMRQVKILFALSKRNH